MWNCDKLIKGNIILYLVLGWYFFPPICTSICYPILLIAFPYSYYLNCYRLFIIDDNLSPANLTNLFNGLWCWLTSIFFNPLLDFLKCFDTSINPFLKKVHGYEKLKALNWVVTQLICNWIDLTLNWVVTELSWVEM